MKDTLFEALNTIKDKGVKEMYKLEDLINLVNLNSLLQKQEEEEKKKKKCGAFFIVLIIIAVIAGLAIAVYKYFEPDYFDDFDEDDFDEDDDEEDFFEDDLD